MAVEKARTNDGIFIVHGKRTPFGRFGGALKDVTPVDLAVIASKSVLEDCKIAPDKLDHVILGNVVPSSTDTLYGARHLALKLGAPVSTPGVVINRLCGSGIEAILDAARLIKLGEAECVLAAGTENMSMAPHLLYGGRFGTKYGSLKSVDMLLDALTDQYAQTPMGITAENLAQNFNIGRAACDEFAFSSHRKATEAYEKNLMQGEIAAVKIGSIVCEKDEHLRPDASLKEMNGLRPTFKKEGVVTAASASGVVDGAAAVLVASGAFCEKNGLTPLAQIIDGHVVGVDPKIMGIGPSPAITGLLKKAGLKLGEIDLFEINEAFAAQTLACTKDLNLPADKLNIWGGAVAIGHPLAASGVRIALTLARQMKHLRLKKGIASACIGGGQGISMLIKSV